MNHHDAWSMLEEYLDGALTTDARWAVTAHLDDCPICRKHLATQARLRGVVRSHLSDIEPPPGLSHRLRSAVNAEAANVAPAPAASWPVPFVLRLAALLGPALVALWLLARVAVPTAGAPADMQTNLVLSHGLFAHDESLLDVKGGTETVSSWFRTTAGLAVSPPTMTGYELIGGRLLVLAGQPVAQLVYESEPDDTYLSLLHFKDRTSDGLPVRTTDAVTVGQQGTMSFATWSTGEDRAALVGALPVADVRRLAEELANSPADGVTDLS